MRITATLLIATVLTLAPVAWAQTDDATSLANSTPLENVNGGAVQERAPGLIVEGALARHEALKSARLSAQRTQETSDLSQIDTTSSSSSSSSGLSGLLGGSLGSVVSTLLGGSSSSSLLSTLTGGSSSGGSSSTSGLPPEVIAALANSPAAADLGLAKSKSETTSSSKQSLYAQSTSSSTQEDKFVVRWGNAMLSTMFTSLTIGFQTDAFSELLKDIFRPAVYGLLGVEDDSSSNDPNDASDPNDATI